MVREVPLPFQSARQTYVRANHFQPPSESETEEQTGSAPNKRAERMRK